MSNILTLRRKNVNLRTKFEFFFFFLNSIQSNSNKQKKHNLPQPDWLGYRVMTERMKSTPFSPSSSSINLRCHFWYYLFCSILFAVAESCNLFSITHLKTFTNKPHHPNNINFNTTTNNKIMRHLCLLSLLLLLLTATSNFLVDGRAVWVDTRKTQNVGEGGGAGGGSDMSYRRELFDERVFTLASGPSRRGDGHKWSWDGFGLILLLSSNYYSPVVICKKEYALLILYKILFTDYKLLS